MIRRFWAWLNERDTLAEWESELLRSEWFTFPDEDGTPLTVITAVTPGQKVCTEDHWCIAIPNSDITYWIGRCHVCGADV